MKLSLAILLLIVCLRGINQTSYTGNAFSVGSGCGAAFNIDDNALNTNTSNLGWQSQFSDHKLSVSLQETNLASFSPVVSYSVRKFFQASRYDSLTGSEARAPLSLPRESFFGGNDSVTYDTLVHYSQRLELKEALMKNNQFKFNTTDIGFTVVTPASGTFSVHVGREFSGKFRISDNLSDLWVLGKIAPYYDTLVLYDGKKLPNDSTFYENHILHEVAHAYSADSVSLADQLDDTEVAYMSVRNYTLGWGSVFNSPFAGFDLYLGGNINLIEGLGYFHFYGQDGIINVDLAGSNVINGRRANAGMGASLSFGGTLVKNNKLFLSMAINNIGAIRWSERKGGTSALFDSENDTGFFAYPFGTNNYFQFNDQWEEAGINIANGTTVGTSGVSFWRATAGNLTLGSKILAGNHFAFGGDAIIPINGRALGGYEHAYIAAAAQMYFNKFGMTSGVNNFNQALNIPLGFTFGSQATQIEFTLSTADVLAYFKKDNDLSFSLAFGTKFRFR